MAYDATGLVFEYETIFHNYMTLGGVDLRKLNIGFEPGEQAASGTWEGLEKDKSVTQFVKDHNIGGAMIWAANPSLTTNPQGAKLCPQTAEALNAILQPTYAWGPPPKYTKCDPSTGYLSASQVDAPFLTLALTRTRILTPTCTLTPTPTRWSRRSRALSRWRRRWELSMSRLHRPSPRPRRRSSSSTPPLSLPLNAAGAPGAARRPAAATLPALVARVTPTGPRRASPMATARHPRWRRRW